MASWLRSFKVYLKQTNGNWTLTASYTSVFNASDESGNSVKQEKTVTNKYMTNATSVVS